MIQQTYDSGKTWVYQPVQMAQYCLWLHSHWKHGGVLSNAFWVNVEHLVGTQREDGAFAMDFDLPWQQPLASGWTSGLAQGQVVSVLTRAYQITQDPRYGDAARAGVRFMLKPESEGGCLGTLADLNPSLSEYSMIIEYPYHPDSYTLNGSLFALLGLYDWMVYDPSVECVLKELAKTIGVILPYYDIQSNAQGYSAYNLQHISQGKAPEIQPIYHQYNTMLVWAVDSFLPNPDYSRTWRSWASYVGQPLSE